MKYYKNEDLIVMGKFSDDDLITILHTVKLSSRFIEKNIADFNFMVPYIDYFENKTAGMSTADTLAYIKKRNDFWGFIIRYYSGSLGRTRSADLYLFRDGYIFDTNEFNTLFRYAEEDGEDVEVKFGLVDIIENNELGRLDPAGRPSVSDAERSIFIENLIHQKIKPYLDTKRKAKGLRYFRFPISHLKFQFVYYPVIIWKILTGKYDDSGISPAERAKNKIASRFWKLGFIEWLVWNIVSNAAVIYFALGSLPVGGWIIGGVLMFLNIRVSFKAIVNLNIASMF